MEERTEKLQYTTRRVKVYQLEDDQGAWKDRGTGYVEIQYLETGPFILVTSEKDPARVLMQERVILDNVYQIQHETLIIWKDPDTEENLALSFQEALGCKDIWDKIEAIQKEAQLSALDSSTTEVQTIFELPNPILANIEKILETIESIQEPSQKEAFISAFVKDNYLPKIVNLFNMCEDLEDLRSLHVLFNIFKGLVLLNDAGLLDILFSEEYIMHVMGALEYDPDLNKQVQHREYLKNHVVFKEVVPFQDAALVNKIHQTFRIQYLKDVVLPRILDDPTFATLNSLIYFNHVEIVTHIQNDEIFLTELYSRLKSPKTTPNDLKDLISFLQELCNLAKNLQVVSRPAFYQTLMRHGLPDILEVGLSGSDVSVRLSTVNILDCVLSNDTTTLRAFLLSQKPAYTLFHLIVKAFLSDPEMGIRVQLTEVLRTLIDTASQEAPEKSDFLNVFYAEFVPKLVDPLQQDGVNDSVKESILNLLSFCVQQHGFRIKYYILGNNIMTKAIKLLKSKEKHLVLGTLRFFRTFVGMNDDFYHRHLTKHNLFEPIIEVFKEHAHKYNLINSAFIELFEFIRKENVKHLIQHLVENFGETFKNINYVETFKGLILRYDQNKEEARAPTTPATPSTPSKSQEDTEEEDYFNKDDEDEAVNPLTPPSSHSPVKIEPPLRPFKPLIDYSLDDDPDINQALNKSPERDKKRSREEKEENLPIKLPNSQTRPSLNIQPLKKPKISINISIKSLASKTTETETETDTNSNNQHSPSNHLTTTDTDDHPFQTEKEKETGKEKEPENKKEHSHKSNSNRQPANGTLKLEKTQ